MDRSCLRRRLLHILKSSKYLSCIAFFGQKPLVCQKFTHPCHLLYACFLCLLNTFLQESLTMTLQKGPIGIISTCGSFPRRRLLGLHKSQQAGLHALTETSCSLQQAFWGLSNFCETNRTFSGHWEVNAQLLKPNVANQKKTKKKKKQKQKQK